MRTLIDIPNLHPVRAALFFLPALLSKPTFQHFLLSLLPPPPPPRCGTTSPAKDVRARAFEDFPFTQPFPALPSPLLFQ